MGKPRQVTVDGVVDLLRTGDKPVYTMSDIAEEFDVAKETVRRRMPDVTEEQGVREETIGRTNVYWYEGGEDTDSAVSGEPPGRLDTDRVSSTEEWDADKQEEDADDTDRSVLHQLATWRVFLVGVGTVILGYANLVVAHVAATAAADTVALGLLALTLLFVFGGLAVMIISLIALIVTMPPADSQGVTDGGVSDV